MVNFHYGAKKVFTVHYKIMLRPYITSHVQFNLQRNVGDKKNDKKFKLKPITDDVQETEQAKFVSLQYLVKIGILQYGRGKRHKSRETAKVGNFVFPIVSGGSKNYGFTNEPNFDEATKKITISCSGSSAGLVQYFEKPIFVGMHGMTVYLTDETILLMEYLYHKLKEQEKE
eukprot:Pgem_evm1s2865